MRSAWNAILYRESIQSAEGNSRRAWSLSQSLECVLATEGSATMAYSQSATESPKHDPAPIFEAIRGNFATELLAAAVTHFKVFENLKGEPHSFSNLRRKMGLAERPASV